MIKSFRCKDTEKLFNRSPVKAFQSCAMVAQKALDRLDAATKLSDLGAYNGLGLEALQKDRKGQHSIRINKQYRVCFIWKDTDAYEVEITDYH